MLRLETVLPPAADSPVPTGPLVGARRKRGKWTLAAIVGVLGIATFVLAFPHALTDFWEVLFPRPSVVVRSTSTVKLSYDTSKNVLLFRLGLNVHNEKNTPESIRSANGTLEIMGDTKNAINFSDADITFVETGGNGAFKNTPLIKDAPRNIWSEMACVITEMNRPLFRQRETRRVLSLTLKGEKERSYNVKFCFDLGPNLTTILFKSGSQPLEFVTSTCE